MSLRVLRASRCLLLTLAAGTLQAADSCSLAKAKLEEYFLQLPHACRKSTDCEGYYYRANACAPAVILARPGVPKAGEARLLALQSNVRQACAAEFSKQPACSAAPYRADCRNARCVDAASAPDATALGAQPLSAEPNRLRHATIRNTCAPWDGPAIGILLSGTAGCKVTETPYIQISLWKNLPPKAGKTYQFDISNSNGQASRCMKPGKCEAAVSGTVSFEIYDEGKRAKGRYELHFKDSLTETGSFDADWCQERGFCG
jgi:hypothetical protein